MVFKQQTENEIFCSPCYEAEDCFGSSGAAPQCTITDQKSLVIVWGLLHCQHDIGAGGTTKKNMSTPCDIDFTGKHRNIFHLCPIYVAFSLFFLNVSERQDLGRKRNPRGCSLY